MPSLLATEKKARYVGYGIWSDAATVSGITISPTKLCTKQRAEALNCRLRWTYATNQIVHAAALMGKDNNYSCSPNCGCQGNCSNCSCNGGKCSGISDAASCQYFQPNGANLWYGSTCRSFSSIGGNCGSWGWGWYGNHTCGSQFCGATKCYYYCPCQGGNTCPSHSKQSCSCVSGYGCSSQCTCQSGNCLRNCNQESNGT